MAVDLPDNVVVSKIDELASWCRKNSLWPMPFATACCGIELMATGASKHDIARVIDLQDKIQREGTLSGAEFNTLARQQPKRALVELPVIELPRSR